MAKVIPFNTEVVVACLQCGYAHIIEEDGLLQYGQKPGAPIASIERMVCVACGNGLKACRRVVIDDLPSPSELDPSSDSLSI